MKTFLKSAICIYLASMPVFGQTTYNLNTTGTSTWSNPSIWTVASGPGTTFPGSGGTGNTDVANLNNLTATTGVTYDAGTSGFLGQLNMQQTVSTANTTLTLAKNLTLQGVAGNDGSLYTTESGTGITAGQEIINLGNFTLDIAAGGTFTLGSTSVPTSGAGSLTSASTSTPITTSGTGALTIDGTLLLTSNAVAGYTQGILAPVTLDAGGTINIADGSAAVSTVRLIMEGNFTSTSNSTIKASGTQAATGSSLFFEGATTDIVSGTSITGFGTQAGTFTFINFGSSLAAQTINLGVLLPGQQIRNANTAGTIGSPVTFVKTISSTATSGSVSNAFDQLSFANSKGFSNVVLALGSNLNLAAGQTAPFVFSVPNVAGAQASIDLSGFTYNATASSSTVTLAPSNFTTAGNTQFNILNSGASSISGGHGIFEAADFDFHLNDISVGSGVILQAASATATFNVSNLGVMASGVTKIDPTSIFYFTGAGTGGVTSNRTIGRIDVGTGSSASVLQISSVDLSVGGDITVNAGATFDLHDQNVTEVATAGAANGGLNGSGTVTNSIISSNNTLTLDTTHGNGSFSGVIQNGATGSTIALTKTGVGTQTLSGVNTYTGATSINGGTLLLAPGGSIVSAATVNTGGTLAGSGQAASLTLSGGSITPGAGIGTDVTSDLKATSLLFNAGSSLTFNLDGASLNSTRLSLSGAFTEGTAGIFTINLTGNGTINTAGTYDLVDFGSTTFTDVNAFSLVDSSLVFGSGLSGSLELTGDQLDFVVMGDAVPEPSTWALMFGGFALLVVWQRRRRPFQG